MQQCGALRRCAPTDLDISTRFRRRFSTDIRLTASPGVDARDVMADGNLIGRLLETFVVAQLRAELPLMPFTRLHHLRTEGGRQEVDIVAEIGAERVVGIEVKATASPGRNDGKHLAWLRDHLHGKFPLGVVLHTGPQGHHSTRKSSRSRSAHSGARADSNIPTHLPDRNGRPARAGRIARARPVNDLTYAASQPTNLVKLCVFPTQSIKFSLLTTRRYLQGRKCRRYLSDRRRQVRTTCVPGSPWAPRATTTPLPPGNSALASDPVVVRRDRPRLPTRLVGNPLEGRKASDFLFADDLLDLIKNEGANTPAFSSHRVGHSHSQSERLAI